jgi:NadR type nicotinamide-nucleotide adenylyltransferase
MTTGVVVGKFFPPHRGHKHLIEYAAARCDELWVCLLANSAEEAYLPRALRHAWLEEIHPGVRIASTTIDLPESYGPVPVADPEVVNDAWNQVILWMTGQDRFDLLFSSERGRYAEPTAAGLGARHVLVDPDRIAVPMSGTAVRADPAACFPYLEPCVRAHYVRRIRLAGAESTGKTTLAAALAARFRTIWMPEYGREYSIPIDARHASWATADFARIAAGHREIEAAATRRANAVLFCDTGPLMTAVWHRGYLGRPDPALERLAAAEPSDLVVLCEPDFPFAQDGFRAGDAARMARHAEVRSALDALGTGYITVRGSVEERAAAVEAELLTRFGLRPPASAVPELDGRGLPFGGQDPYGETALVPAMLGQVSPAQVAQAMRLRRGAS